MFLHFVLRKEFSEWLTCQPSQDSERIGGNSTKAKSDSTDIILSGPMENNAFVMRPLSVQTTPFCHDKLVHS